MLTALCSPLSQNCRCLDTPSIAPACSVNSMQLLIYDQTRSQCTVLSLYYANSTIINLNWGLVLHRVTGPVPCAVCMLPGTALVLPCVHHDPVSAPGCVGWNSGAGLQTVQTVLWRGKQTEYSSSSNPSKLTKNFYFPTSCVYKYFVLSHYFTLIKHYCAQLYIKLVSCIHTILSSFF